ncbi:alpha/beta hydrolase [Roseobacter sp. YSTF-M11]|uniref:Alpha/beta hydrolase n=1 Tax=Roseobacter insulae TaxID=2859783 RepID=A0A9X1FYE8_9RHOB|nr:alpha/beta hydrolase [Roseobacter insulae]MBW4709208.1 alpha/beta hydrolase [Roseobacter insulae]
MCILPDDPGAGAQPYRLTFRPASARGGLDCWLACPSPITPNVPPLVAVRGVRRDAKLQAALFADKATASGRPVIAPVFDRANWLGYQRVVLCGRADLALLDLILGLRSAGIVQSEKLDLFGFSGGAQFAHRFAMLHPERVSRLNIASPGWYTFPDNATYPYGLWPQREHCDEWSHGMISNLDRFLILPMTVSVGQNDCDRDRNTRTGPAIDAQQGVNRLDRVTRSTGPAHVVEGER